jgi:hypothetical protein
MNDKKRPIIGAAITCIVSGAVGAIVGYRMGGFGVWPSDGGGISQCIIFGSMIGVAGAVVTSLLLLAAAREKLWLVALVGCLVSEWLISAIVTLETPESRAAFAGRAALRRAFRHPPRTRALRRLSSLDRPFVFG